MQKILLATSISILLSACGSGGGGSSSPTPTPTPTNVGGGSEAGQLQLGTAALDIDGLGFKTASINAITVDGKFSFNEGEAVTFLLGKTEIFTVNGNSSISLSDAILKANALTAETLPTTANEVMTALEKRPGIAPTELNNLHKVSNTLKLLLVLDADRDASNGIDLAGWNAKLNATEVNLNTRLDDNLEFLKVFKDDLITPLAMDVAEPLLYLYTQLGKKIPAQQIASIVTVNGSMKSTKSFTFHADGNIEKNTSVMHRLTTEKDESEDIYVNSYDKFGVRSSRLTTQTTDMDTDTPATEYSKYTQMSNGYLSSNGYPITTLQQEYGGTDIDNLALTDEYKYIYLKDIIQSESGINYSNDGFVYTSEYLYTYDEQGRETKQTETNEKLNSDNIVVTTNTVMATTSYTGSGWIYKSNVNDDGSASSSYEHINIFNDDESLESNERLTRNSVEDLTFHNKTSYIYNNLGNVTEKTELRDSDKDGSTFEHIYRINKDTYNDQGILTNQSQEFDSSNSSVQDNQYNYTFVADGKSKGMFESIQWTENRWSRGSARTTPFRVQTYTYTYDANSGLLTGINSTQIYNRVENYRQIITLTYNADAMLTQYYYITETVSLSDDSIATKTITRDITYSNTADGLGYLLRNQQDNILNENIGKADYRVVANTLATPNAPQ
ncbi:MAG: hypothetical protein V7765_05790 [Oleispira sp.]